MAIFRSPGTEPVHLALLSGHAIVIGPEGRELPPPFEAAAMAAGCRFVPNPPRQRPPKPAESAPEPTAPQADP